MKVGFLFCLFLSAYGGFWSPASAAPQYMQKRAFASFGFPHAEQNDMVSGETKEKGG
jgi:hypothetical protein